MDVSVPEKPQGPIQTRPICGALSNELNCPTIRVYIGYAILKNLDPILWGQQILGMIIAFFWHSFFSTAYLYM